MTEGSNKFKDLFYEEANDQLATLSSELLNIEKDPTNIEHYATLMRAAHTIKGGAATMGYGNIAKLAHALEDVFHLGERKVIVIDPKTITTALSSVDRIRASLNLIKENSPELDVEDIVKELALVTTQQDTKTETVKTAQSPETVQKINSAVLASALPTSVRVDVERLDLLMGLFEEMLMLRLKLDSLLEPAIETMNMLADHEAKEKLYFLKEFEIIFAQLARLLSETQGQILLIRLVPLEMIFSQFPRMVRDLALRENKNIEFRMEGGGVELDRTVLSGLGGALAHLLRNAVDHGISKSGTIVLSARHVNDRIHVSVEDNGAGIDYERVKTVAIERGLITKEASSGLHKQEITELLFHPNMSTNTEVTDISGRGVGLSAVQSFVKEVGGHISVVSPASNNKGTAFILDLPISLATVKVLLVESSRFTFALPFAMVVRTISFSQSEISKSAHQEMAPVDGKLVPMLHLNELLNITFGDSFYPHKEKPEQVLAVLLEIEGERILVAIDRCVGEQELLIKSLPPVLQTIRGFSGSALLPDGRTILLLDAHGLLLEALSDILESTK